MSTGQFIPNEIAEEIKVRATLEDVANQVVPGIKKRGASLTGVCPTCNGVKFNVHLTKNIFKCFHCGVGGKDPIGLVMLAEKLEYIDALRYLAKMYNIIIPDQESKPIKLGKKSLNDFRNNQLKESGIPEPSQKTEIWVDDNTKLIIDRYQSGILNALKEVEAGDDMILHYIGLDRRRTTYKPDKANKLVPFKRVRFQYPQDHLNQLGKPVKYNSPYKSGNHLWIPEYMIKAYESREIVETLYIVEGEKKADKMCVEGLSAVAISGIHNFANAVEMPQQFTMIMKACSVKNVVFMLDSDWDDLGNIDDGMVAKRPTIFFSAVKKFRDYFYSFNANQIHLQIYFGYGLSKAFKGVDDLLVRDLRGKESEFVQDLKDALIARDGLGKHVQLHNITSESDWKIKELFHIESKESFFGHYKEVLIKVGVFQYWRLEYQWNEDLEDFELTQKVLPHEQFWKIKEDKYGNTIYQFLYKGLKKFLQARGFGLFEFGKGKFRWVQKQGMILQEIEPQLIKHYVLDFAEALDIDDLDELMLRGSDQYLGPSKLSNLAYMTPEFLEPNPNYQVLVFKNVYWKITADTIEQKPINDLPSHIWKEKIIQFEPNLLPGKLCDAILTEAGWDLTVAKEIQDSDWYKYLLNTSNFHWRKTQDLTIEKGIGRYDAKPEPEFVTVQERINQTDHLMSKLLAAGYVLHEYKQMSNMKGIICMDGKESEVGKSVGGSGKSIYATSFEHLLPTVVIDAKKPELTRDQFLYDEVDERTAVIVFDDCRVNLDFEFFFGQITRGVSVNKKGEKKFTIEPPKLIFTTNHAINGDDESTLRRQYQVAFSDYYNAHRKVSSDFGYDLFKEWEYKQWNLFYIINAIGIQLFLKHGLQYRSNQKQLRLRMLRQSIGEEFIEWADLYYSSDFENDKKDLGHLNIKIDKQVVFKDFREMCPSSSKWIQTKDLKKKIRIYCEYRGLQFNPGGDKDGRIKSNGIEYILVGESDFKTDANGNNSSDNQPEGTLPF